jgi:dethiobiotin synthetase
MARMSKLFVTGSGTGVGKTVVVCLLVHQLQAAGRSVRALKPVTSGFDRAAVAESDTGRLLAAMDEPFDAAAIGSISPWRFRDPISPDMAAAREGRRLDVGEIVGFCRFAGPADSDAVVLVEGIGGAMVPLSDNETVLDWMAALNWPVLLVGGSYLGSLSHTLTAMEAIRLRGLPLAGIVISESPDGPVPLDETAETIGRFAGDIPVIALPRIDPDRLAAGPAPPIARRLGLVDAKDGFG